MFLKILDFTIIIKSAISLTYFI